MPEMQSDLVRRSEGLRVRRIDVERRTALFVASDESLDSHEEILEQDWRLERFRKNPTILWAHDQEQLPIGRGLSAEVVGGELQVDVQFAPAELNPFAEQVFGMLQAEFIRACSVGFRPGKMRREKRGDREVWVLSQNELYELSILPIGSNPNALGKGPDPLAGMKAAAIAAERAGVPAAEDNMADTTDKGAAELAELRAKFDTTEKALDAARAQVATLEKSKADLETSNAALTKENGELKSAQTRGEIEAFVGKKILPTEVDSLIKWAAADKTACLENIKARADLTLTTPIVTGGEAEKAKAAPSNNGAELGARLA